MAHHETALDAIFEDGLSDAELEEGEMAEDELMDVDTSDGRSVRPEEREILEDEPSSVPSLDDLYENRAVGSGRFNDQEANGESGLDNEVSRPPQPKKRKGKRSRKRSKTVNVARFVQDTCKFLQEKKYPLVWAAVKHLGVDGVTDLVKEVDVIERCGGQMTVDGKRRRTPGGVMWNILRSRVQPAVYKAIMSQGNEVQKHKEKKAKESLKRNRMDVDEPIDKKRQKVTGEGGDFSAEAPKKQSSRSRQLLRPVKELLDVIEGPEADNSSFPAIHVQKAWVEGLKKKADLHETAVVPVSSLCADYNCLKAQTGGVPENISVPVFERLRVPVQYGDLPGDKKAAHMSQGQIAPVERSVLVEEALCGDGRQSPEKGGY